MKKNKKQPLLDVDSAQPPEKKEFQQVDVNGNEIEQQENNPDDSIDETAPPNRFSVGFSGGRSRCFKIMTGVVFMLAIIALVIESQIMPKAIQKTLHPTDRVAQMAMASFLTPVEEIFAFLEDTMAIKVGYAIAAGRLDELNMLLNISVFGGALSGFLAFLIMLLLSSSDDMAGPILNPSESTNQDLIDAGCDLIPTTHDILDRARVYWLLIAATWLPKFCVKGIMGFMAGTGEMVAYLIPMITQATIPITIWFVLVGLYNNDQIDLNPLSTLGISYGSADWVNMFVFFGFLASSTNLRMTYNLRCLLCTGSEISAEMWNTFRSVVFEGLQLMAVDISVQLSLTITIYVAAHHNLETAYKLAATNAAYWAFGPSYFVGYMLFIKILGSRMIAEGNKEFIPFMVEILILLIAVSAGAIIGAYIEQDATAFEYAESACIFASKEACGDVFADIFHGNDSMSNLFGIFGPLVSFQMIFIVMRTTLAMFYDFSFLWKASVGVFVVVYTPSILVAHYVWNTAESYYVVMYLPHFAMIVVFGYRLYHNLQKFMNDEPGPWKTHARRMSSYNANLASRLSQRSSGIQN